MLKRGLFGPFSYKLLLKVTVEVILSVELYNFSAKGYKISGKLYKIFTKSL